MKDIPLYNSIVIKTYLEYLETAYPDVNHSELLEYAGIANYEVEDRGHWLTQTQVNRFHECMSRATSNPNISKQAGRYMGASKSSVSSVIRQSVTGFLSPSMAYWATQKIASYLTRHVTFKNRNLADNKIELTVTPQSGSQGRAFPVRKPHWHV